MGAEAKRKCRLNVEAVRMAKELGLNPRKLIKNIPNKSQLWKAPVHIWIRDMYEERMGRAARKNVGKQPSQGAMPDKMDRDTADSLQPNGEDTGFPIEDDLPVCMDSFDDIPF